MHALPQGSNKVLFWARYCNPYNKNIGRNQKTTGLKTLRKNWGRRRIRLHQRAKLRGRGAMEAHGLTDTRLLLGGPACSYLDRPLGKLTWRHSEAGHIPSRQPPNHGPQRTAPDSEGSGPSSQRACYPSAATRVILQAPRQPIPSLIAQRVHVPNYCGLRAQRTYPLLAVGALIIR